MLGFRSEWSVVSEGLQVMAVGGTASLPSHIPVFFATELRSCHFKLCFCRTGQTRTILNRCIIAESLPSSYQLIPGFLEFLHYAMEDIKNCLAVEGAIFSTLFIGCIIMNFVFLLYPKRAMLLCFATSLLSTIAATVYSALSILHSSPYNVKEWPMDAIPFILNSTLLHYCLVSLLSAISFVINFIGIAWTMKSRKQIVGLWEVSSKLIKCNPQLLSQPVLSLFVIVIATAYFLVIMLLLLGCRTINISSLTNTVNFEQSEFTWLLLPATLAFIWFIDLIKKGQNTILAGAASKWYFTRRFNLTFYPMSAVLKYNLGSIAAITVSNIFTKCKDSCPAYQTNISNFANISVGVYGRIQQIFLDHKRDDKYSTPLTTACTAIHFALQAWKIGLLEISTVVFIALTSSTSMFTSLIPIILNAFVSWKVSNLFIDGLEAIILGLAVSAYEDCVRNETADVPKFSDSAVACFFIGSTVSSKSTNSNDSKTLSKSVNTLSTQSTLDLSQSGSSSEDYETASLDSKYSKVTEYRTTGWRKQVGSDEEFKSLSSYSGDKKEVKTIKTVKRNKSVDSWNIDWW